MQPISTSTYPSQTLDRTDRLGRRVGAPRRRRAGIPFSTRRPRRRFRSYHSPRSATLRGADRDRQHHRPRPDLVQIRRSASPGVCRNCRANPVSVRPRSKASEPYVVESALDHPLASPEPARDRPFRTPLLRRRARSRRATATTSARSALSTASSRARPTPTASTCSSHSAKIVDRRTRAASRRTSARARILRDEPTRKPSRMPPSRGLLHADRAYRTAQPTRFRETTSRSGTARFASVAKIAVGRSHRESTSTG